MISDLLLRTADLIADFYDGCKFGCEGCEGYRKSTDLDKLVRCIGELESKGLLDPARTIFLDLGCADGRVNVLMSYFVKKSIGIEIDRDILAEFEPRKRALVHALRSTGLPEPPDNIFLYHGSSLDEATYDRVFSQTGVRFTDVDLFYTYITLHDLFGDKIGREAKPGALYMVYGFNKILPRYDDLDLVISDAASQAIAAVYRKGPVDTRKNYSRTNPFSGATIA